MNYYNNYNYNPYNMDNRAMPYTHMPMQPNMNVPDNTNAVYDAKEGLMRGNLFSGLYKPYLKQEPFPIKETNEQERMLNKVRALDFANLELNLYLDIYPDDRDALEAFKHYEQEREQITKEYETKYGPLLVSSKANESYPWAWNNGPWPWDKDRSQ